MSEYIDFEEFLFEDDFVQPRPKTKPVVFGKMTDGTKVKGRMKSGLTIELSAEEFSMLQNMRESQGKGDMLGHSKGGKDYFIAKKSGGKYTIFHNHKTLHELVPVGVFRLPIINKKKKSFKKAAPKRASSKRSKRSSIGI